MKEQSARKRIQYNVDSEIRDRIGMSNDVLDPTTMYPGKVKMPQGIKHRFNQRIAAEVALLERSSFAGQMVASVSGKTLDEDPNPIADSDVAYTNMRYMIFRSNVISPNTHGMHHEALLTEDTFQIECDMLRPRKWIRVRNWEELCAIAAEKIPTKNGIDPKTVRWMIQNTQISRKLFLCAELNTNMRIPFTLDWERYLRARNSQNPKRPFCLRSARVQMIEILRENIRNGNAVNLAQNRAFVLQHSYQPHTCTWARQNPNYSRRIDGEAELAKLDNPKRYPIDYSDYDEYYRDTVLGRKNRITIKKNTWKGERGNGFVSKEKGQDED